MQQTCLAESDKAYKAMWISLAEIPQGNLCMVLPLWTFPETAQARRQTGAEHPHSGSVVAPWSVKHVLRLWAAWPSWWPESDAEQKQSHPPAASGSEAHGERPRNFSAPYTLTKGSSLLSISPTIVLLYTKLTKRLQCICANVLGCLKKLHPSTKCSEWRREKSKSNLDLVVTPSAF